MKNYNKIMKNIEQLGERYCKKYNSPDIEKLQNNWWYALDYFFRHSFMRGRQDKLSNEYRYFTQKVLGEYFHIDAENLDASYKRVVGNRNYFDKKHILKFKRGKKLGKVLYQHEDFKKEVVEKNPVIKHLITPKEIEIK